MQGVFLDLNSIHPDDLDLQGLQNCLPEWKFYDHSVASDLSERLHQAEIVVCNKTHLDAKALENAPHLKLICVAATGTNNIDLVAAKQLDIRVCNARNYATASVVEHVFSMILTLTRQLDAYRKRVRAGDWSNSQQFCVFDNSMSELAGKTLGIIGYGVLGQAVAKTAQAFSMNVAIAQRNHTQNQPDRISLSKLLETADIISLHCPLTPDTQNLLATEAFRKMKPGAIVINTARGGLIDEAALIDALQQGEIAAAALDVLKQEPPSAENPILNYQTPNLIVTPHVAWASQAARQRLLGEIVQNIESFKQGHKRNQV